MSRILQGLNVASDSTRLAIGEKIRIASVSAYRSTNQTSTDSVWLPIQFDVEDFDTSGFHSTSSNTSRFTAPFTGNYLLSGVMSFDANAAGFRATAIRRDGTQFHLLHTIATLATAQTRVSDSYTIRLDAGSYVEYMALQNSGSSVPILGGVAETRFGMVYLGA